MAEILVFMNDVQGADAYRTAKLPKRGDVVTVQEDGWKWGTAERGDAMFRILAFPGEPVATFAELLSTEAPRTPGDRFGDLSNTLQYRGFRIDVDGASLPAAVRTGVADTKRAAPIVTIVGKAAKDSVLAAKMTRPPLADPAVIGKSRGIIG